MWHRAHRVRAHRAFWPTLVSVCASARFTAVRSYCGQKRFARGARPSVRAAGIVWVWVLRFGWGQEGMQGELEVRPTARMPGGCEHKYQLMSLSMGYCFGRRAVCLRGCTPNGSVHYRKANRHHNQVANRRTNEICQSNFHHLHAAQLAQHRALVAVHAVFITTRSRVADINCFCTLYTRDYTQCHTRSKSHPHFSVLDVWTVVDIA